MWQEFTTRPMEKPPFKAAYLQRPADKSLSKYWYVCFWIWSESQNKLIRKRITRITISSSSVEESMGLYGFDFNLYGWKHTGATALFKATKDLILVQGQCGHSDIKQTIEYLRVLYYESQIEKFPTI